MTNGVINIAAQQRGAGDKGHFGYVPRHPGLYRAYNLLLAGALLLALAPLMVGLAVMLRLVQGPGVIVQRPRLGQHRTPFQLYSFATAAKNRDYALTDQKARRSTRLGAYLRATGLDALPQLVNVIKGDMNILGPRPLRSAIAQIEEARDPLFAVRFAVKPGMTGHTQAIMGEGTSQRLRGKLTYRLCRRTVKPGMDLALLARIGRAQLTALGRALLQRPVQDGLMARARRKAQDWNIQLETPNGIYPVYALSQGLLTTPHVVTGGPAKIVFGAGDGIRKAQVDLGRLSHLQGETVFQYAPAHENAAHLISRYLRDEAMIAPARPRWRRPRLSDLQYEIDLHVGRETVPANVTKP